MTDHPGIHSNKLALDIGLSCLVSAGLITGLLALTRSSIEWLSDLSEGTLVSLVMFVPALALALLERIAPAAPHKSTREWLLNLKISLLSVFTRQAAIVLSLFIAAALASHSGIGWIDLRFASGRGMTALIAASLLALLLSDFLYYWWHRWQHKSPILWQQHKLHHMDESVNVTTNYRTDWLEQLPVVVLPAVVLVILFKLDPVVGVAGIIRGVVVNLWAVFFHANLRLSLGWASVIVGNPQVHRIHHSRLLQHRDRNFASLFPIWDYLFGTYYHPARDEFPPTGVDTEPEVVTLAEAVTLSFRGWRDLFRGWLAKRNSARSYYEARAIQSRSTARQD